MINCIIVDDEQLAIDVIVHYVNQTPHLKLTGSFTNPLEALDLLSREKIDLIFLDIQMPELSGIDFIKTINRNAKVILTTAYPDFALESYELYVVDYLIKPIRFTRFLTAVQKVIEQTNTSQMKHDEENYIFVKTESKGKVVKINFSDIDYIESMKNYMVIHRSGQKTLVFTSLKELEDKLPKKKFIRIHKSFIVPIDKITGMEGNLIRLRGVASELQIGESYKPELMEMIRRRMIL